MGRVRDDQEVEEHRANSRFAQTDYSTFDSEIVDKHVETFYCLWCGQYALVMESRLNQCAKREADDAFAVDIKHQIVKFPGITMDGGMKVIKRDNGKKLELQHTMNCKSCSLPIAYRHCKDINQCKRIFVLQDAVSNDPTCVERKIEEYKQMMAALK